MVCYLLVRKLLIRKFFFEVIFLPIFPQRLIFSIQSELGVFLSVSRLTRTNEKLQQSRPSDHQLQWRNQHFHRKVYQHSSKI